MKRIPYNLDHPAFILPHRTHRRQDARSTLIADFFTTDYAWPFLPWSLRKSLDQRVRSLRAWYSDPLYRSIPLRIFLRTLLVNSRYLISGIRCGSFSGPFASRLPFILFFLFPSLFCFPPFVFWQYNYPYIDDIAKPKSRGKRCAANRAPGVRDVASIRIQKSLFRLDPIERLSLRPLLTYHYYAKYQSSANTVP